MDQRRKKLRSGYTTGACAAAAAKAATLLLLSSECGIRSAEKIRNVDILFPDGSRVQFTIHHSELRTQNSELISTASVIKDAGDDPDVTDGAEIVATVLSSECGVGSVECPEILLRGGKGVGVVTKPGLVVPMGEPAINPVPRKMITEAVREAIKNCEVNNPQSACTRRYGRITRVQGAIRNPQLQVTISVPQGEALAKKTLNHRLGIMGGISILGTTGIVRPISTEAWTATITASMDVAKATGCEEIVLSTGRTSEKAHMKKYKLPEESYVMMGDYLEFSLIEAKRHGFKRIHLCAQWAKMIKTAMSTPQTHIRHGALNVRKAEEFLQDLVSGPWNGKKKFNTAREIFDYINSAFRPHPAIRVHSASAGRTPQSAFVSVCVAAKQYAEKIASGIPVIVHLVSYEGDILADSE